jgi:hypothetical protein
MGRREVTRANRKRKERKCGLMIWKHVGKKINEEEGRT